ncbi:hypothetical protein HAX54_008762 [Datura stramonium]|uniref:Flavin-containing monooxygenase n=1 Tax=Datura stramonium TaxID=4076 RepID=A0ABS8TF45_DATST|nr:hypothetical protein [Datura stramonium]
MSVRIYLSWSKYVTRPFKYMKAQFVGLAVGAAPRLTELLYVLGLGPCCIPCGKNRAYDHSNLRLPRQFCELPYFPFPPNFPEYPTKYQFISYLESYMKNFEISPRFNESVHSAKYDETCGLWRVKTVCGNGSIIEYICRWLVVATGENAEKVVPEFEGLEEFDGHVMHACDYKTGKFIKGRMSVVDCWLWQFRHGSFL